MAKLKELGMMLLYGLSTISIYQAPSQVTPMSTNQITKQAMTMTGNSLVASIKDVSKSKGFNVSE